MIIIILVNDVISIFKAFINKIESAFIALKLNNKILTLKDAY
jgi:hypothetical protein